MHAGMWGGRGPVGTYQTTCGIAQLTKGHGVDDDPSYGRGFAVVIAYFRYQETQWTRGQGGLQQ